MAGAELSDFHMGGNEGSGEQNAVLTPHVRCGLGKSASSIPEMAVRGIPENLQLYPSGMFLRVGPRGRSLVCSATTILSGKKNNQYQRVSPQQEK